MEIQRNIQCREQREENGAQTELQSPRDITHALAHTPPSAPTIPKNTSSRVITRRLIV